MILFLCFICDLASAFIRMIMKALGYVVKRDLRVFCFTRFRARVDASTQKLLEKAKQGSSTKGGHNHRPHLTPHDMASWSRAG
jgi:hypothetical protein